MEPLLDRSRIERLVRTTLAELGDRAPTLPPTALGGSCCRPIAASTWRAVRRRRDARRCSRSTPARIGVGRAGTRYRTNTLLALSRRPRGGQGRGALRGRRQADRAPRARRADHARARQAHLPRASRRRSRALATRASSSSPSKCVKGAAAAGLLRRRPVGGGASTRTSRRSTARSMRGACSARLPRRHAAVRAPLARQGHGRDRPTGRRRGLRLHLRRAARPRLRRFVERATTSIVRRAAPPTPIARSSATSTRAVSSRRRRRRRSPKPARASSPPRNREWYCDRTPLDVSGVRLCRRSSSRPSIRPARRPTRICPCCGTQFGADDLEKPHAELRKEWVQSGAEWWSQNEPAPDRLGRERAAPGGRIRRWRPRN